MPRALRRGIVNSVLSFLVTNNLVSGYGSCLKNAQTVIREFWQVAAVIAMAFFAPQPARVTTDNPIFVAIACWKLRQRTPVLVRASMVVAQCSMVLVHAAKFAIPSFRPNLSRSFTSPSFRWVSIVYFGRRTVAISVANCCHLMKFQILTTMKKVTVRIMLTKHHHRCHRMPWHPNINLPIPSRFLVKTMVRSADAEGAIVRNATIADRTKNPLPNGEFPQRDGCYLLCFFSFAFHFSGSGY